MHVFADRERDRGFAAGGAKIFDRRDAAQHVREEHIKNRAEDQRTENADRHVAFRIARFLRRGRDGIESDVGEKHNAGRAENAENTAVMVGDSLRGDVRGRRWNERRVVRRIDKLPADADEKQYDSYFQNDDEPVDECRFFRAANQQQRQEKQNEQRPARS